MSVIAEPIRREILRRLEAAEKEHDVTILFAVESGSRAWGFESPDSDYDVRFVYVRHRDWYLSVDLEDKRDVIEYPIVDEIDCNGWDIRKALQLLKKSNPAIAEWLNSPIVYREKDSVRKELGTLLTEFYRIEKGIYHFRSMAKTNFRTYLQTDMVRVKKYFYVLRPLLAIRWLETYKTPAPILFDTLLELLVESDVRDAVDQLLMLKKAGLETDEAPKISVINQFIESELTRLEKSVESVDLLSDGELLNAYFRKSLDLF